MRYYIITSKYEQETKLHKVKAENGIKAHKKAKAERAGKKFIVHDEITTQTIHVGNIESVWLERFDELKHA